MCSSDLNYANADTLYRYAKGRYDIGTITENEMLQLEINVLTEETNCINSALNLRDNIQAFRSYLGITEDIPVKAEIEFSLPEFSIDEEIALLYAIDNSPDIKNLQYRKIQSESNVAYARANAGLKADVYLSVGLTQTGEKFRQAYKHPLDQQYVSIGLSFPLLDWGKGRGQVKLALSNRDLIMQQITQNRIDYETDVRKSVNQFNLQRQRVTIAEKTDVTAARRHTVARKLYILGKSTILDLNSAVSEKDSAKRGYISALHSYWNLYYLIRSMTLFDFERNIVLTEDLNQLLK